MNGKLIHFDVKTNKSGFLVPLEALKNIPFEIKRVFYIYHIATGATRGKHAQKKLKEIVVCLKGSCKIKMEDAKETKVVELSQPEVGLFIGPMVWREMFDFSSDCILLALADDNYDEGDYIRDYPEFCRLVKKK